ncbi:MAG TPA: hypothetical protein VGG16_27950 [Streptosporangiaceae bacterium]
MRKSLTRTAAAAALVLVVPAGVANATVRPAPARATLSIAESRTLVWSGRDDVIAGTLATGRQSLAGRVVFLDRLAGGKLTQVKSAVTGKRGGVSFVVRPGTTARYELVFKGAALVAPAHSGVVTVRVIP